MSGGAGPAVVLLSGGLDSATCLAIARAAGHPCHAVSFRYGQRHAVELDAARAVAEAIGVQEHVVIDIDLGAIGGSALTSSAIEVPKHARVEEIGDDDIPVTYVPARNTIFLSLALALAEVRGSRDIYIGVNALDYSGYPDCRPEYVEAFQAMARLATRDGVSGHDADRPELTIHTPLIDASKGEIIRRGLALGVDYALTTSCYDPGPGTTACGRCDACLLRRKGFADAGLADPVPYRAETPSP